MHESALDLPRVGRSPRHLAAVAARPDALPFSVAVGVVALHSVVDAFFTTEPGTEPRDHLLRGLVSLGLLALAAIAYPRLPSGGRAAFAAVLGLLSLEGAGLAIADARAGGARGEDWTGFLLAPTGI